MFKILKNLEKFCCDYDADVPCNYASYLMSFLVSLAYIIYATLIRLLYWDYRIDGHNAFQNEEKVDF